MERILKAPLLESPKSVLVLGPRQVGKSTLLSGLDPDMEINLASQSEFLLFQRNPDELTERIALKNPRTVFIDEIQRIPSLMNDIQVILDKNKKLKFYLSGSSARKLKRGNANLLPGRIFVYRLGPLSCLEFGKRGLDSLKALQVGTLPEPYLMNNQNHAEKLLTSYTGTYLQEEILAETLIREVSGFSRFLETAAIQSGHLLDFSKLASKSKVSRSAARRYFEILEDTLLCERVDSYTVDGDDLIQTVKHPRYYLFDIGILNGILNNFSASPDRVGHLFEHLFYNQLLNSSYALDVKIKVHHFRTHAGWEVDFVVSKGRSIFLIECKTAEPDSRELVSLEKLNSTIKGARPFVACLKCKPKKKGVIEILEWQDVIREIFK